MNAALIVHGGAHAVPPEKVEATKAGCTEAARVGWSVLDAGGSALDAVEAAIRALEDDPTFNAGYGSELNTEGQAQMDAALMDGATLAAGAVGAIQGVRHPVSVARRVLAVEPVLLVAEGARRFAAEQEGAELCDPAEMISDEKRREWKLAQAEKDRKKRGHDTVGCVALDQHGNLATGTSTGGTNTNQPGRIGDSPLVGCGLYADNTLGACSMTGDGESIVRVVLAKTAVDLLLRGECHPEQAAQQAMDILRERVDGRAGCILLDPQGRVGWAHNEPNIAVAYQTEQMDAPRAFIHKDEEKDSENVA